MQCNIVLMYYDGARRKVCFKIPQHPRLIEPMGNEVKAVLELEIAGTGSRLRAVSIKNPNKRKHNTSDQLLSARVD